MTSIASVKKKLLNGWEVRLGLNGRVYYYSGHSHTIQILPPPEAWDCEYNLPYGYEMAVDYSDRVYFLNHIAQRVSYNDPRVGQDNEDQDLTEDVPLPRHYVIKRDEQLGFGFIAGSEKPVIVRSVSPGGPSENKLQPGDQIIKIGSEHVKESARERVIDLIKYSTDEVDLTVLQPSRVASSSFLKPGRKSKGMNRPRVRFADNDATSTDVKSETYSKLLCRPGVLRVVLEVGETSSFKFDLDTTAGDIVGALCEKLEFKDTSLYSLVLKPPDVTDEANGATDVNELSEVLLAPWDQISKVVTNPAVKHHECCFRLTFVSKDIHKLSREDSKSFQYHYQQSVNDVVSGVLYKGCMSTDELLRMAAFHMLETVMSQSHVTLETTKWTGKKKSFQIPNKITLKQIEKDFGLHNFLPHNMVAMVNSNHNNKEHRKKLQQYLKTSYVHHVIGNHEPHPPSPPTSPTPHKPGVRTENALLKLRMQYLKILLPQHLYGGRYFDATIMALPESDITLLVGHHYGVSQLVNSKTKMSSMFADFTVVKSVEVAPCLPDSRKTNVRVDFKDLPPLVLAMHPVSAQNFAFMISGYCRVHGNNEMMLTLPIADNLAPEYFGSHKVKPSLWNYPPNQASQAVFCDFSEPVTSTLICQEIPDEVRAMYQQSFIERETHQTSHTTDDEGVATPNTDLSPLSSASSMTSSAMTSSSSPSSGIGSVTSKNDKPTLDEVPAANDDNEWDELMVALYTDNELPHSPLSPPETNNETLDENKQQIVSVSDQEDSFVENKDEVSSMEDYVVTHNKITPHKNNAEVIQSLECNGDNNNGTIEETSTEFDGKDISKDIAVNITEETTYVSPTSSVGETQQKDEAVAVKRPRFSSFKPSSHENSLSPDPMLQENAITSDQLQARIDPLTLDVAGATFDIENEEIVTSPLPVTDLARDLQKKKRRSWISVSAKKSEGKKNKSFIRGLFSPSRSYALNRKNESETNSAKKWKFGNIFKSSPERGSRFFSFKAFSRRKRSHTLNTSATNSPEGNQVYSVFPTEEPGQLQRSFSVENVSLRPRAKPTNPRPVSFMTFLPLNGNGNVENVEDDETTPAPAPPEMNDFSSKVKESEDLEIERKSAPAKPQRPSLQHPVDEVAEIIIPTSKKKKRAPMCPEDVVHHVGNEDQKLGRDSVKVEDCDVTVHETYVENIVETPVQHNEKQNEIMKQAVYENVAVETTVVVEKVHEEIVDEEKQIVEKQDFVEEPSYNVTMQQSESLDINSFEVDLDDDLTIDPTLNEVTMGRDESILVEEIFAYLDAPVDKSSYSLSSDGSSGEDPQLDLCEEHDTEEPDQLVQTTVLEKPVELVEKFENLKTAVEKPEQQEVVESVESFVEKEETVGQTELSFKKVPEEEQFVERQEFVEKENRVVETPESFIEKQIEIFDEEKQLVESVVNVEKPQVVETADSVLQTEFDESQEIVVEKETEIVEENPFVENQESPIENFHEEKEFVEKENQNVEKPETMVEKQNEIVEEKKEFVKSQEIVVEKPQVAENDIIDEEKQLVEKPKPFVEKDKKFNLEKQELMENHETAIPLVNGNKGLMGKMGQTKVHASLVGIQSSGDIPCDHSLDGKDCQEIDANNSNEQTPRRANDVINGPFISAKQVNSVNTTTSQTAELHEIIESETEKRNSKPTNVTPHAATLRPSYHSLISPRIFQHSKERKVFSSIKPPVMNSQRKTNGTGPRKISSVSVTRPVVPPKPSYL